MMKPFGRTDFERAFRPGEIFIDPHNGDMIAHQQMIGQLILPSGQLIACDPSYLPDHNDIPPFARTLLPAAYRVTLAMIDYLIEMSSFGNCGILIPAEEKENGAMAHLDSSAVPLSASYCGKLRFVVYYVQMC